MDRKSKAFIRLLKDNRKNIRREIDLFIYKFGYRQFIKVKNEVERSSCDIDIKRKLEEALWTEVEHLSHVQTKQGIFNILHAKFNGKFVDIPSVYIDSFPNDSKFIFVMPAM